MPKGFLLAFLVSVSMAGFSRGQEDAAPDANELARLKSEVDQLRHGLEETRGKVADAASEARRTEMLVELLARERELVLAELLRSKQEAAEIERTLERVERERDLTAKRLGERLAALYRLGTGGVARLLLAPEGEDRLRAARILDYLARRDHRLVSELDSQNAVLAARRDERERIAESVQSFERHLAAKGEELREARARQERAVRALKGQERRDARRLEELEARALRLERILELIDKGATPTRLRGEDPHRFRGALEWPVEGPILAAFGRQRHEKFAVYVMNKGIEIASEPGQEVRAVFPGHVRYSRWLKGYGNLVIVDHGEHFLTLYGRLGGVSVSEGDEVRMKQRVGMVSIPVEAEPAALYFEIRDGGEAVEPLDWLRPRDVKEP